MMPSDWLDGKADRIAASIRARALADAERAARAHRCAACWTPLWPYEVTPPGGPSLTITTCPVCDRWRPEDEA